ncbi:MAG: DEAD/DEAH box helicase [Methylophilaceae bacterium]
MTIANKLPVPGLLYGTYPELKEEKSHTKNRIFSAGRVFFDHINPFKKAKAKTFIDLVRAQEIVTSRLNTNELKIAQHALQIALKRDGFTDQLTANAFAIVNKVCIDVLGIKLFDSQIFAAHQILNNYLTEMATGEGKTFAVALATATAGLAGMPVHVITANDHLAQRDADSLQVFYKALGLSVDAAIHGQEPERRRAAYQCDVTYCTAKELVFDYLRDSVKRNQSKAKWSTGLSADAPVDPLLLRGLCMAIVDEADSILIDEARVPLILSKAVNNTQENDYYNQSLALAKQLIATQDFKLDPNTMLVSLTELGREKLEIKASALSAIWHNRLHREETICQALAALYLYHQDKHYLVDEDQVHIIDETTGRLAKGRTWSRGLHQLIELKEACKPSPTLETITQITYQRFFPRYLRLGGISGTLYESRRELSNIYGLRISQIPLRLPSQRSVLPTRLFKTNEALRLALVSRVAAFQQAGRPVLIGTESVIESELLSQQLNRAGLLHVALNARNDQNEADLIAKAGLAGAVTVTTNMAGRGTDIKLGQNINLEGGLHVISCQVNTSRRIDRQLAGRCARQGDSGSVETWVSLEASLLQKNLPSWLLSYLEKFIQLLPSQLIKVLIVFVQKAEENYHLQLRKHLLSADKIFEQHLSFGRVHD